jgi:hypothetical protein
MLTTLLHKNYCCEVKKIETGCQIWPEPIFMKLGIDIMAPESISTAYVISPISLCIPVLLLGNGSVKTLIQGNYIGKAEQHYSEQQIATLQQPVHLMMAG